MPGISAHEFLQNHTGALTTEPVSLTASGYSMVAAIGTGGALGNLIISFNLPDTNTWLPIATITTVGITEKRFPAGRYRASSNATSAKVYLSLHPYG